MKSRFAAFLVAYSKIILVIFIILALGCAALIPFVHVNEDMTKYLPKDSSMRRGLDLMEAEFGKESSSTLKVMFGDLTTADEKEQILRQLEGIPNVESVSYEPGDEDYNRGRYTLYVINCDYEQYSDEAAAIWESVRDAYEETHDLTLGGNINDTNVKGLPLWIALSAVGLVFLILLIMANAWIEPIAFLITIGIAVAINMGTYILFPSISKTSFGIVAILQLALSMDYSIMLLNRYRQQRSVIPDKRQAMRESLELSFGAIFGSSLTTFAGLLALVFMSFTMGADIGLALAKGVIISLICIFTVLPALLLGFDGLMGRTMKRTLSFDHPLLSRNEYRLRIPLTLLFLFLIGAGLLVRSGVDFSYSQGLETKIDEVFGRDNTIVMVYSEGDSTAAGALAETLDDREEIRSAVCYESSLGKRRTAADMKTFIDDMSEEDADVFGEGDDAGDDAGGDAADNAGDDRVGSSDLDEDTIRLVYYDYYAESADEAEGSAAPEVKLTLAEFVHFLQSDVIHDETFGESISDETRDDIDDMEKFTDASALTRQRNAAGLAGFFGMKKSEAEQLLLYYQIKSGRSGGRMTVPAFVSFLIDEVANDSEYGSMFDQKSLKQLKSLRVFTKKKQMTKPREYAGAAQILGMDEGQMRLIYVNALMSDWAEAAEETAGKAPEGTAGKAPEGTAGKAPEGTAGKAPEGTSGKTSAKQGAGAPNGPGVMSITELAETLRAMAADPLLAEQFGTQQMQQLIAGLSQIGQLDPGMYDIAGMVQTLTGYGMPLDAQTLTFAYAYQEVLDQPELCRRSVQSIVHFMLEDESVAASLSKKQRRQLKTLRRIIDASVKGSKLTAKKMAKLFGMKASDAGSIYLLNQYKHGSTDGWTLSAQQFVNFLVTQVLSDPRMKSRVGSSADELKTARKIINHAVCGTEFTSRQMADLLGEDSADMSPDDLEILYEFYGSRYEYDDSWTMDLVEMVHHLDDRMMDRPAFASSMDEQQEEDLEEMREDLDEAVDLLQGEHYGRMMISADLPEDGDETRSFMEHLTTYSREHFDGETYLVGSTPMAYEMSQSFRGELNRITLITAFFILIIVLLTFRQLATPVILVLMIQCAVFLTMGVMNFVHFDMNYLALLIVQSLMMGATIDYAIVYTSYYVEHRIRMSPQEAIRAAYRGSLQTILTSATILIAAVGVLSFAFSEPATRQICRILSLGCLIATLLVIFLLPGILACLDRLVVRRRRNDRDSGVPGSAHGEAEKK